jgi:hypothetical protein
MANRRFIDFPIAASVGDNDIVLIWQDGLNKQTTKATLFAGSPNSLAGLTDVDISALANGQILQYNSTTSKWENVDRTDIDLDQLGDVTIVSPTNGQVLVYNSSTSKWENSSAGFVPYTGAVTTVNLGAQSILAGSFVKAGGTSAQFLKADGSVDSNTYLTTGSAAATYVPYTGATADVNLGTHDLTAERGTFQNNGSSNTLTVNHTSGSGYGIIVTKGGANEALYVSKTSGSGNAMTVIGGRTSLVDLALSSVTNTAGDFLTLSGGVVHKRTAAEVRTDIGAGTVTSVAALTLGTSGTDLSSTVANGTTTPVITLNVPTASATNRGALSSADWSMFNAKQNALTLTTTGTSGVATLVGATLNIPQYQAAGTYVTSVTASSPLASSGGTTPNITIQQASGSQNGFLSSTDWTTFNNKQNALTNPVTGTGTSGQVAYFTGTTTISSESNLFWNQTDNLLGIGTNDPKRGLHISGTGAVAEFALSNTNMAVNSKNFNIWANTTTGFWNIRTLIDNFSADGVSFMNLSPTTGNILINKNSDSGDKLQITGGASTALRLDANSGVAALNIGSGATISVDAAGVGGGRFFLNDSGNLGIGTTTPTGIGNYKSLTLDGSDGSIIDLRFNASANGRIYSSSDASLGIESLSTTLPLIFKTQNGSGSLPRMYILPNGNVGINTGSPVGGGGAGDRTLAVNANSGSAAFMTGMVGGTRYSTLFTSSSIFVIETNADIPIQFNANNNARMSIFSNGNVSISNSPSDAGFKLDVNGTGRFKVSTDRNLAIRYDTNITLSAQADSGGPENLRIYADTFRIYTATSAVGLTERFTIANTGAATFSSSVTATGNASTTPCFIANNNSGASGTSQHYMDFTAGATVIGRILRGNGVSGLNSNGPAIDSFEGFSIRLNQLGGSGGGFSVTGGNAGFSGLLQAYNFIPVGIFAPSIGMYQPSIDTLGFSTNTTRRLAIASNGNVGIGANTPNYKLNIFDVGVVISSGQANWSTNTRGIMLDNTNNGDESVGVWFRTGTNHLSGISGQRRDNLAGWGTDLRFYTHPDETSNLSSAFERMRITSEGNLQIGTSVNIGPAPGKLDILYSGLVQYGMNIRSSHTDGIAISFVNSSGTQVGTIYQNSSSTAYNTSSDYRLKTDLKDFNGVEIINKIKTYDFKWKTDNTRSYGVIAHELKEVIDYAVYGEKDLVTMQGVDYSKLVPIMVKAIQELKQEINTLKN